MKKKKIIVVVSGYFDPLHQGHLEYFEKAKKLGDILIVIVNNDKQAILKKGVFYFNENERLKIISCIKGVDEVVLSIDDEKTIHKTLEMIKPDIFAKGGDWNINNLPKEEKEICEKLGIQIIDGLGKKIIFYKIVSKIKSNSEK
jgi:cytidyltransferase-like protein